MPCYHPLKGFSIGKTAEGKSVMKVVPYSVDHMEFNHGCWYGVDSHYRSQTAEKAVYDFVEIPCGKCIGCILQKSREWANRCMMELSYHEQACFITLTYDDEHVPMSLYGEPSTGEMKRSLTLRKRDFQLFMKRLRKMLGDVQIRFFASGEYGSHTMRPHYHAIIFGWFPSDAYWWQTKREGKLVSDYFRSPTLEKLWPYGMSLVGNVEWRSCAYVARYTAKKQYKGVFDFEEHGMEPPFLLMSRKPGLAKQYYLDNPDCCRYNKVILPRCDKDDRPDVPVPKYFRNLFEHDFPEESSELKEMRLKAMANARRAKLVNTDLSYLELLQVEEDNKIQRTVSLARKDL